MFLLFLFLNKFLPTTNIFIMMFLTSFKNKSWHLNNIDLWEYEK